MTARIWELDTGREMLTLSGHKDWVKRVAFSPNGKWVATASADHTTKLWDAATGDEISTIEHTGIVNCVAFSPNGTQLATADQDNTIRLWEVQSIVQDE